MDKRNIFPANAAHTRCDRPLDSGDEKLDRLHVALVEHGRRTRQLSERHEWDDEKLAARLAWADGPALHPEGFGEETDMGGVPSPCLPGKGENGSTPPETACTCVPDSVLPVRLGADLGGTTEPPERVEEVNLAYVAALCEAAVHSLQNRVEASTIEELRGTLNRDYKIRMIDLALGFLSHASVDHIVQRLQPEAVKCCLRNLRYYPYDADASGGGMLFSYASAGHDPETAHLLEVGQVTKFFESSQLHESDSFWALALQVPTVFILDNMCEIPVRCYVQPGFLPLVRVTHNRCMHVLARHASDAWVDYPLVIGGRLRGKFSCDVEGPLPFVPGTEHLLDTEMTEKLLTFYQLIRLVAPMLECLFQQEVSPPAISSTEQLCRPEDAGREILECESSDELYEFCAKRLPELLNCRHGVVFTRSTDSLGSDSLVLRRASSQKYEELQNLWNCSLKMESREAIAWVARSGGNVCLHDLGTPELRKEKLQQYSRELESIGLISDIDEKGDVLIVPVPGVDNRPVAVLLCWQPLDGEKGTHFMERHQVWLLSIAKRFIGPRLESLWQEESVNTIVNAVADQSQGIKSISVLADLDDRSVPMALTVAIRRIFGDGGREHLSSVFDQLEDGGKQVRRFVADAHVGILNGEQVYPIDGTLAGYLMGFPESCVSINDFERAEAGNAYREIVPGAVCCLASRIEFGDQCFGMIGLLSDRYDLCRRIHGRVLEILAERAGEVFARHRLGNVLKTHLGSSFALPKLYYQMFDAYVQAQSAYKCHADAPADDFDVVDVLKETASLTKRFTGGRGRLQLPPERPIHVSTWIGGFAAIINDILRCAWKSARAVTVTAELADSGWLEVRVDRSPQGESGVAHGEEARDNLDALWQLLFLGASKGRASQSPLERTQLLASRYRTTDGRTATLEEQGNSILLRVPIDQCTGRRPTHALCNRN